MDLWTVLLRLRQLTAIVDLESKSTTLCWRTPIAAGQRRCSGYQLSSRLETSTLGYIITYIDTCTPCEAVRCTSVSPTVPSSRLPKSSGGGGVAPQTVDSRRSGRQRQRNHKPRPESSHLLRNWRVPRSPPRSRRARRRHRSKSGDSTTAHASSCASRSPLLASALLPLCSPSLLSSLASDHPTR
jgi:hypothetical protein